MRRFVGYISNNQIFNASMSSDGKMGPPGPQGPAGPVGPIKDAGNITLVDGQNTALATGNYFVTSVTVNGIRNDKFNNALVRVYTADKTYLSILASNNMLQQGYNFYNIGYDGSTWSEFSTKVAKESHSHGNLLPLTGGTMTGDINMSSHKLTGLAEPTDSSDAVTKKYVDTLIGDYETAMTELIEGAGI